MRTEKEIREQLEAVQAEAERRAKAEEQGDGVRSVLVHSSMRYRGYYEALQWVLEEE